MDRSMSEPLMEAMDISDDNMAGEPMIREMSPDNMKDMDEALQEETKDPKEDSFDADGEYTWEIKDLERQPPRKFSEVFECAGYYWQLLICPHGNGHSYRGNLSVYLCVPDADGAQAGLRRTKFELLLLNQDPAKHIKRVTECNFDDKGSDWGFNQFASHDDFREPYKGFLLPGRGISLQVRISVKPPETFLKLEKQRLGFVGLKNQGATCYMNSLLQTLFNINIFRQAVYQMPIAEDEQAENSIPLALQSLFFKLQFGLHVVSTKTLTQSFGWTSLDAFTQHDVQELARILSEKLEQKMKGTIVEGTIGRLYEGHTHNFVQCLNVDYASTRQESYEDLQLQVKDCRTMYDSFDKYTETEILDGPNQYQSEDHGMQDAKKGILFNSFPPVLQIHLKRFDYDFSSDQMIKINSRYEFPEELDLDRDDYKYLSENADKTVRNKYRLHSVLVHAGGIHGGHYFAFINPTGKQWIKFDDEKVSLAERHHAMDDQFGSDETQNYMRAAKFSNAYMLVYIRESDWPSVMCEVTKEHLQPHVRERLDRELDEKQKSQKQKQESHLYTEIRIATDATMKDSIDSGTPFDLVNFDKVEGHKVKKFSKFKDFREQFARERGIPPENQLWFGWAKRMNGTYRPKRLYDDYEDKQFVCSLRDEDNNVRLKAWTAKLNLFYMEPKNSAVRDALYESNERSESPSVMLLFWKRYHPREARMEYLGHTILPTQCALKQALLLLKSNGVSIQPDLDCEMFEEVRWKDSLMLNRLHVDQNPDGEQLATGDIIIIQESISEEEAETLLYPYAEDYLKYVRDRVIVTIKRIEKSQEEGFELELSRGNSYDEVEAAIANALVERGIPLTDTRCIRMTPRQVYSQIPKPHPYLYRERKTLNELLTIKLIGSEGPDILYYEIMDLPLPEFEKLRVLKVSWHNANGEPVREHKLQVKKESPISSLIEILCEHESEAASAKRIRLLEANNTKICKVFDEDSEESVDILSDDSYSQLRAEAIPQEDLDIEDGLDLNCCHVTLNDGRKVMPFGDPMIIRAGAEETMKSLSERIQNRLQIKDEDFAKWQFRHLRGILTSDGDILEPEDIVSERFGGILKNKDRMSADFLGLQHAVTHSKRPGRSYQSTGAGIKIQ